MKKLTLSFSLLVLIALQVQAQVVWVGINGQTQFCPGDNREVTYTLTKNFPVSEWIVTCNRCEIKDPVSGNWITQFDGVQFYSPPSSIMIRWNKGNFDDTEIEFYGKGLYVFWYTRTDKKYVKLVENDYGTSWPKNPNVDPTITSSVSTMACGSTSAITFTANWKNATSYSWSVSGGAISGSSTGAIITVIPSNGSTNVTATVRGYNSACNVYSPYPGKSRTVSRAAPVVNAITGPSYVCYNAASIENHYVNNIPGATYTWYSDPAGKIQVVSGAGTSNVVIKGTESGSFDLKVDVKACGQTVPKSKAVTSSNSAPAPPVIYQYPYQHCAGSCASYSLMLPTGYASEKQFRYNYGSWDVANSSGSIYVCTNSWDAGYRPIELRSKGICGNYGSTNTQTVEIDNCGGYYMMATSEEDSLTISQMSKKEDVVLFPNPATTSMTIKLPEDMTETEVAIISDKSEVLVNFKNSKSIFTINTSRLGTGVYYLAVADKNKKTTKRFLVE
jgi:hypothetical protein